MVKFGEDYGVDLGNTTMGLVNSSQSLTVNNLLQNGKQK